MVLWKLKDCPRCGGDLFIDRDLDSWYAQCLQCSYRRELESPAELERQPIGAGTKSSKTGPAT